MLSNSYIAFLQMIVHLRFLLVPVITSLRIFSSANTQIGTRRAQGMYKMRGPAQVSADYNGVLKYKYQETEPKTAVKRKSKTNSFFALVH